MLKLEKLLISNVGRLVGDHEFSLKGRPFLIQVDGQNQNTGGSSGSAKSTIFNAFEYLLGVNQIPATVLQSRLTKASMKVEGYFDYNGQSLIISRSKTEGLSISLDGIEIVSGSNKIAEEKLDEILGLPRELLRKMIHKRQKEGGFFLNFTPKECHAFLAQVLDLKTWSEKALKAENDIKKYEQLEQSLTYSVSVMENSLTSDSNTLNNIVEPTLSWDPSILSVLEKTYDGASKALTAEQKKLSEELAKLEKPTPPAPVDNSEIVLITQKILELKAQEAFEKKQLLDTWGIKNTELQDFHNKVASIKRALEQESRLVSKLEELKKKILILKNSTCPTCKQPWSSGHSEMEQLVSEAKQKASELQKIEQLSKELPTLEKLIIEKTQEVEEAKKQTTNSKLSALIALEDAKLQQANTLLYKQRELQNQAHLKALELITEKENQIRKQFNETLAHLTNNANEQRNLLIEKKTEYKAYLDNKLVFDKNKKTLADSILAKELSLQQLKTDKETASLNKEVATIAHKAIKGYMNSLFQDALDSIAVKATQILSKIPNMSTASIYFEGFKETKAGSIKDEVSAVLTMDDEIGIPIKSMSGGERTAIDLAIDLAVIDVIEERVGKGLDLFILDEPFDGLDSICKEQCLQILQLHTTGKRIIIVDHSNETKELVHDRIIVIRNGQESYIAQ